MRQTLAISERDLVCESDGPAARVYGLLSTGFDMAMLGVLNMDEDALEAVRRLLSIAPKVEAMMPKSQQPRHRVGCAIGGHLARAYDLIQPYLERDERIAFCRWAYRSGVRMTLRALLPGYHLRAGANIPMNQLLNALNVLLAIDGEETVPDLGRYWRVALQMFEATLNTVVGQDGYPVEDMGYGTVMFARVSQVAEAIQRAGILNVHETCPRYLEFGNAILHFVQPWGQHLSTTGDHGDDFGQRVFVLARLAEATGNACLLWLLGTLPYRGEEIVLRDGFQVENSVFSLLLADRFRRAVHPSRAKPCPPAHYCDRDRGIVSFRSGWRDDDTFVVFDGAQRSPAAQGHEHASCGHFSISAHGEYFAIDTGRYNMEQNCHNVVLINGKSGRDTRGEWEFVKHAGLLTSFTPGRFVDAASVDSSHQHNCFCARRFLGFVKGRGAFPYVWIVDDINKNNDWAEYWWQLHTCPENRVNV